MDRHAAVPHGAVEWRRARFRYQAAPVSPIKGIPMIAPAVRLLIAQSLGEYGAMAGAASSLERFFQVAEETVRNPRTGVPLGIAVLIAAYFLLRRRA
jgi:hypothetical protein